MSFCQFLNFVMLLSNICCCDTLHDNAGGGVCVVYFCIKSLIKSAFCMWEHSRVIWIYKNFIFFNFVFTSIAVTGVQTCALPIFLFLLDSA